MNKNQAKTFKITFTKTILLLAIAILVICVVGIGVSVYRIIEYGINGFTDVLKYPFLIGVCVFCIVLVIAIFVKSQYIVDDQYFTSQYGFIKSKLLLKDVTSVVLDTDTYKLTVYMGEEYCVLSLAKEWNEEFVRALLAANPKIDYSFTFAETDGKDKK